jgi:hypothetical protein
MGGLVEPEAGFYRAVYDAYLRRCCGGFRKGDLIDQRSRFDPEDRLVLSSIAKAHREGVFSVLSSQFGNPASSYRYRTLHPNVFDSGRQRSRNVFVELFTTPDNAPVLVSGEYVEVLSRGASAATRVFSWEGADDPFDVSHLLSPLAFREIVSRAGSLTLDRLQKEPFQSVLMGWILEAAQPRGRCLGASKGISVEDLKSLSVVAQGDTLKAHFDTEALSIRAECSLDRQRLEPEIVVFVDSKDP